MIYEKMQSVYLPDNSLGPRSDRLKVLVTLEDCEFGIANLHRVEHGGQPGGHAGA